MTREELIALGRKIFSGQGTEQATQEMIELFNANVPHSNGASLFYYPESDNAGTIDISKYNPTVEEVIDKCLVYDLECFKNVRSFCLVVVKRLTPVRII